MNTELPTYEVQELSLEEVIRQLGPEKMSGNAASANDSQLREHVDFEELALLLQA